MKGFEEEVRAGLKLPFKIVFDVGYGTHCIRDYCKFDGWVLENIWCDGMGPDENSWSLSTESGRRTGNAYSTLEELIEANKDYLRSYL
jgi:hypothetical protein